MGANAALGNSGLGGIGLSRAMKIEFQFDPSIGSD
jgi:hypothetical protein